MLLLLPSRLRNEKIEEKEEEIDEEEKRKKEKMVEELKNDPKMRGKEEK